MPENMPIINLSPVLGPFLERNPEVIPTASSSKKPDGRMVSKPLENMFSHLPKGEVEAEIRAVSIE